VTTLPASAQRVAEAARVLGLEIEVREFPEGTRTAADAARAIGCEVAQIVKSLVFVSDGDPIVCLVSGVNRVDTNRLASEIGATVVGRADADAVRSATGYAVGGVPPFGHSIRVAMYCDRDLLSHKVVWAAAGTPTAVFPVDPQRLIEVTGARVIDLREES
jgi:prolyl-tRNA editing enzyme YbaK/EbsC (Cys-tRNA(Pro) deacylase)